MRVLLIILCFLLQISASSHAFSTSSKTANWLSQFIDFLPFPITDSVTSNQISPPPKPDYLKLALQWPPAVCRMRKCKIPLPQPINFTIHGLWPAFSTGGDDPHKCSDTEFEEEQVSDIEQDLKVSWPNLERADNRGFWKHEWAEHGTCSDFTVAEYFNLALLRKHDNDPLQILYKNGIRPHKTKTHNAAHIQSVIETATSHEVRVRCGEDPLTKKLYCVDFSGVRFRNCPITTNCQTSFVFRP